MRVLLIAGGSVAILLPAWLPNRPSVPVEQGTVELLQAVLLAAASVVMWGASSHAGSGLIAAALLILYVFNRVIGSARFWKAALGDAFAPGIPGICKSYLELLACYLLFIGALGLSITLARRLDPR